METITKKDLAFSVAEATGCKKIQAAQMVDRLFEGMRENLTKGNRIEVRGFGVLNTKTTKANPAARNPSTGETIYAPAKRKTHFKPGRLLKEALHQPR